MRKVLTKIVASYFDGTRRSSIFIIYFFKVDIIIYGPFRNYAIKVLLPDPVCCPNKFGKESINGFSNIDFQRKHTLIFIYINPFCVTTDLQINPFSAILEILEKM